MVVNRLPLIAAGVFLLSALVAGYTSRSLSSQLAVARQQVRDLAATAQQAATRAAHDSAEASAALRHDARTTRERDSLVALLPARLAARDLAHAHADSAVAAAPDTCAPVIAALQGELAAAAKVEAGHVELYAHEAAAHDSVSRALLKAQMGLAEAQRDLAALAAKAADIHIPKPSLLSRLLPEADLGCTAGVSPLHGDFDAVCGVSLGWAVKL